MRRSALLGLLLLSVPARCEEKPLNKASSAHFIVYYESFYPPPGILPTLESLHGKLLLDLVRFAPWAKDKKIEVNIYKNVESYRARTGAKEWSGGHVELGARRIHVFEGENLRRTLAHELSHLFFDDFFVSKASDSARAPLWLTEGVAVMMEWDYGLEKDHPYYRKRTKAAMEPLESFLAFDYHDEDHQKRVVSDWYLQAYSLTRFLMRRFPGEFYPFCQNVREGYPLGEVLERTYGYRMKDVAAMESLWKESLSEE